MRISDWSSDVCSSDLHLRQRVLADAAVPLPVLAGELALLEGINVVEGFRAKQAVRFARRPARKRLRQGEAQVHQRVLDAPYGIRIVVRRTFLDRTADRGADVRSIGRAYVWTPVT